MSKNIIICCDGTSNKFSSEPTNVVRLYSVLDRNQKSIYIPGVGTMASSSIFSWAIKKFYIGIGLAFGYGLQENVSKAYKFLMKHYTEGDKIFLFGFSRGAYTIRVLSALIHKCGLLDKDNEHLFDYAYELLTRKKPKWDTITGFKLQFSSRDCPIHFMGMWDSVSSIGMIGKMRNFAYTSTILGVKTIRHALALDEWRTYYKPNKIKRTGADIQKAWFPGFHSDVGGGHPEEESGLSKVPLVWMMDEAHLA